MDEERYVSIGDGNVYLVKDDPLDSFDIELSDMIQHDEIPEFDSVTEIEFSGSENYKVAYKENNQITYSEEDVYFTNEKGNELPLDSENVDSYLDTIRELNLTDYMSYNATEYELKTYGMNEPDLDIALKYREATDEGEEEKEGTVVLHISCDSEEKKEAETDSQEEITAYARIGKSKIIYKINGADYEELMKASCNDLRHQETIWVDSDKISQAEISLEGTEYKLKTKKKDKKKVWYYQKEEIEADDFCYALNSLSTSEFTEEKPTGKEEISLLLQIDDENQPEVRIELYRYDGNNCLAVVDGEPVSLINRSYVVNLIEAVNAIVLN